LANSSNMGISIAPVERVMVRDTIVQRIRGAILAGALTVGTKLPSEHQLAREMGVSRTSIREALRELEAMGLVVCRHGVGAFVASPNDAALGRESLLDLLADRPSMAEFLEVRRHLETHCAALAAQRRTEEEVVAIEAVIAQMGVLLKDPDAYLQADFEFHGLLVRAAHNTIFEHILNEVSGPFRRELILTVRLPGATESSYRYHRLIKEAVQKKNPGQARKIMDEHLNDIEALLEEVQRPLHSHEG
jgi:GntR family transcriptional repressor for pyruvate dehydrogenase complex